MTFRHDINLLRALAVLVVVLFHFQIAGTRGGFIGVDIFFVISGYLMTQIIFTACNGGHFSLREFYFARAKRIIPALIVVCLAVMLFGWFLVLPKGYQSLSEHVLASLMFTSNVSYAMEAGRYFDATAGSKWLLHTWSLSAEWQFYLIYPLAVLLARRWLGHHGARSLLAVAAICSFALAIYAGGRYPSANFYLLPSRAWEMLVGGLVYLYPLAWSLRQQRWLSGLALIVLLASAALIEHQGAWPTGLTLVPVLASALFLSVAFGSSKLAQLPPIGWLGRISYSLYLWHWPVVVALTKFGVQGEIPWLVTGLAVSLICAQLSFRYVEEPMRRIQLSQLTVGRNAVLGMSALGAYLLVMAGSYAVASKHGLSDRVSPEITRINKLVDYKQEEGMREGQCFLSSRHDDPGAFDDGLCLALDPQRPNILLIGDSHAAHFWSGLKHTLNQVNVLQATASGCKPLLEGAGEMRCTALRDRIFSEFLPSHHLDAVILSANWVEEDLASLTATIDSLKPHADAIYVLGPIVAYRRALPELVADSRWLEQPELMARSVVAERYHLDQQMNALVVSAGGRYGSVYAALCNDERHCLIEDPQRQPIQFDATHLTESGSRLVVERLLATGLFAAPPLAIKTDIQAAGQIDG